ncbi:hypothetical protein [Corynebacterium ulceribovis]|uniref:Rv1157c family protein n=1 Tax=Corynebacterium ulceribovis TaxID=487732 RepID=UPI000369EA69|nr:hypothetical protein [Corynebacterium ulceribovis]
MALHSLTLPIRRTAAVLGAGILAGAAALSGAPEAQAQSSVDPLGRPSPAVLNQLEMTLNQPWVPKDIREKGMKAVGFFRGDGEPGTPIPKDGPRIYQFFWPTMSEKCIGGKTPGMGAAVAIPGPAKLPLPGVKKGETAFIFTGLGTAGVKSSGMRVRWINISNGRTGVTPLKYTGVNEDGPGTLVGTAKTGRGHVLALTEGSFVSKEEPKPARCSYFPTAGYVEVK